MISAIILAAGESKRMGNRTKQILTFGHDTMLEMVIRNLQTSRLDDIVLVLGHEAEQIMAKTARYQVRTVVNPQYTKGMSTSIICGIESLDLRTAGMMIMLGDLPFVDKTVINQLISAYINGTRHIVVPTYRGNRGNPVIFDSFYFPDLLNLKGDIGGRNIIKNHPDDVLQTEVHSNEIFNDIDVWEDYLACKSASPEGRRLAQPQAN